jgi:WD40 repeat protein
VISLDGGFSTRVRKLVGPDVRDATISHDGTRIVTIHEDGTCRALSVTSGEEAGVWTVSTAVMNQLVRLDDGVTCVAGSDNGTIQVFTFEGARRELTSRRRR